VRQKRPERLIERVRWPGRGNRAGRPGRDRQPEAAGAGERLDWREVQERLGPVRHRWDVAILSNLDPRTGSRPADLLVAINAQATGRQLRAQVLSGRLRQLEQDGYIGHEDVSTMPLNRLYYLRGPGQRLLADLAAIFRPGDGAPDTARAPGGRQ
jgi:DNA-binding HxlR family transcriptional regulator